MKAFRVLILVLSFGSLVGCASPALVEGMTHADLERTAPNPVLAQAIEVQATTGGKTTYPWWISRISNENFTQALIHSLQSHGYYISNNKAARYILKAEIKDTDYPWFGLDLDVTTTINYRLYELTTNRMIMNQDVKAMDVATFGDAALGSDRMRIALERSAKKNIGLLTNALQSLDPSKTIDPALSTKP
jgi:hypothetical protein